MDSDYLKGMLRLGLIAFSVVFVSMIVVVALRFVGLSRTYQMRWMTCGLHGMCKQCIGSTVSSWGSVLYLHTWSTERLPNNRNLWGNRPEVIPKMAGIKK